MTSAQSVGLPPGTAAGTSVAFGTAVVDGVDVDAVAAAAARCPGVATLDGGRHGSVVTYLPGRTVPGVAVGGGRVTIQVRSRWGVPVPDLARSITTALTPLIGPRPVDVVVADIDDPPGPRPAAPPAQTTAPSLAPSATSAAGPGPPVDPVLQVSAEPSLAGLVQPVSSEPPPASPRRERATHPEPGLPPV